MALPAPSGCSEKVAVPALPLKQALPVKKVRLLNAVQWGMALTSMLYRRYCQSKRSCSKV